LNPRRHRCCQPRPLDREGYRAFVEAASQVGWRIAIAAAIVLVADLAAMTVYTIRFGQSDKMRDKVFTEDRPLNVSLGNPLLMGWSKIKMLGSRSGFVTMESLVDGTATFGERMIVLGIITLFVSFFFVFVGWGLMLMNGIPILILIPILPGLFVYFNLRATWRDYREAKKKVSTRGSAEPATVPWERSGRRRAALVAFDAV
jgi:hypothetical protein